MAQIKVRTSKAPKKHGYIIALLAVILLLAVAMTTLELTNATHIFHKAAVKPVATTGGALTKGATSSGTSGSTKTDTSSGVTQSSPNTSKQTTDTSTTLLAPWGTFFNNSPVKPSDPMGSTCNTTVGATCQITFTNGSTTKSLEVQNTDSGGAVYWSWTPASIGLSAGTWHVSAIAVLGTQTKTTSNDPLTLVVTQ